MRCWIVVLIAALLTVGCGDQTERGAEPQHAPPTTDPVWDPDLPPEVQTEKPVPLIPGPDLPAGAIVTEVDRFEGSTDVRLAETGFGAQQLFADPTLVDPSAGRQLLVGRTEASDMTGEPAEDGDPIELHGEEGHIEEGAAEDSWIVSWRVAADPRCPCDQFGFVAGIGLSRDEVVRAAEAADPLEPHPSVASVAMPAGLRSLGSLPFLGVGGGGTGSLTLTLDLDGVEVRIANAAGDARFGLHRRFWDTVRQDPWREVVEAHGQVLSVTYGAREGGPVGERPDIGPVIDSLVQATDAEVDTLAQAVVARPVDETDQCELGRDDLEPTYFAGHLGGVRWVAGIGSDGRSYTTCFDTLDAERGSDGGTGLGGPLEPPAAPDEVRMLGGYYLFAGRTQDAGIPHLTGHVPAATARLEALAGGAVAEVHLAETGPTPDRRWFIALFVAEEIKGDREVPATVVAYDADGREIARFP